MLSTETVSTLGWKKDSFFSLTFYEITGFLEWGGFQDQPFHKSHL